VLRAARFASALEFKIDPEIYLAAKEIDLTGLSVERVNEELFKILLDSFRPSRGLQEMLRLTVIKQLFPELPIAAAWPFRIHTFIRRKTKPGITPSGLTFC